MDRDVAPRIRFYGWQELRESQHVALSGVVGYRIGLWVGVD